MSIIVKFEVSREGTPMAFVDGKIAFPERSGIQPEIGEIWEVEVAGTNPTGRLVAFLRLLKKVELVEWTWNDGIGHRSRQPACLAVTASGDVHRFQGSDIPNFVKVVNSKFHKNGKWSNTTYTCVSPEGVKIYSWMQSWGEGVFWPQASWEEAVKTVQEHAPQVDPASLEAVIRQGWPKAAAKFDENRNALTAFASVKPTFEPEVAKIRILVVINEQHKLLPNQTRVLNETFGEGAYEMVLVPADGWTLDQIREQTEQAGNSTIVFVSPIPAMILFAAQRTHGVTHIMHNDKRVKKEIPDGRIISVVAEDGWVIV